MNALELNGVAKRFGGLSVLEGVNLAVREGERVAVIGPNGAGKSTLFNVISGELPLSSGSVHLLGRDVSHVPAHQRVSMGLARSFQLTSLLRGVSVYDNVLAALHGVQRSRFNIVNDHNSPRAFAPLLERAEQLLNELGLWERRHHDVTTLPFGHQKKLEVAMTLALRPRVLLLDEPAAGLDAAEIPMFTAVIKRVLQGAALLFTEHDMGVVFGLADRVVVLARGQLIADGTPEQIRHDERVRELYLGPGLPVHA